MLLRTMSHFDPHRKNALSHAHMWWGFRSFEIGQDCYANSQLLMTNRQSALGQFPIGRVGQFSISADISPAGSTSDRKISHLLRTTAEIFLVICWL
jgi:hypothetical protein